MQEHRGTLILVLGIISLACFQPLGIAAWLMGKGDLEKMDQGLMNPEGRGMTNAGKICGIIALVLMVIWLAFIFLFDGMALLTGGMQQ